jgi:hypothetical protein
VDSANRSRLTHFVTSAPIIAALRNDHSITSSARTIAAQNFWSALVEKSGPSKNYTAFSLTILGRDSAIIASMSDDWHRSAMAMAIVIVIAIIIVLIVALARIWIGP